MCSFEIEVPESKTSYLVPNRVEVSMIDFEKEEIHYSISVDTLENKVECVLPLKGAKFYVSETKELVSINAEKVKVAGYEISISQIVFKPSDKMIGSYAKLLINDTVRRLSRYEEASLYKLNIWHKKESDGKKVIYEPNIAYLSLKEEVQLKSMLQMLEIMTRKHLKDLGLDESVKSSYESRLPKEKIYD